MDYRQDRLYPAFVHRELAVSWLAIASLLGGRHRWDLRQGRFTVLEFGCGHGLNLIFNAAAHPDAQFFGIDFHPSHVARATTQARELGLSNVQFAVADLRDFTEGPPDRGPCRLWPEAYDLVLAHGIASWVDADTRQALLEAASHNLQPGGLFYCSYNTYPGWLSRSPLQMLALELGLLSGHNTSEASLQQATAWLQELLGDGDTHTSPLGRFHPELRTALQALSKAPSDYLMGEYHATHQPLYVGPMHRACVQTGLTHVGSASLPELFPQMLDATRAAWLDQAPNAAMREIAFDLAINQSFRRDLFARGVVPPSSVETQAELASLPLILRQDSLKTQQEFPISMGTMAIDAAMLQSVHQILDAGPCCLGELAQALGKVPRELLPQLALLLDKNLVGCDPFAALAAGSQPGLTAAGSAEIAAFNHKVMELASLGKGAAGLLAPKLRLPIPLADAQIMLAQVEALGLDAADRVQMVWMGIQMAGLTLHDPQGQPIRDEQAALAQLEQLWNAFQGAGMEDLRRLGLV
ncbi:methyltransferase regulatory domain-containing protein [Synechococcus sp. CBW1002]|jgi:SAM-dependent methyltransferase|uniref:class I SAM-dependent methyltransferase n=1 Tax=Synechococcus sp. CBW1002 TaxID=1353134 RepID=UPI0018CC9D93|nr:class I SAM-dependent methyltransferase [Synechococcus sp. CBW1002]QPN58962.1 methyltransferase regulatory domain-containing protein [Synechococcus sp. CBW1002]